MGGGLLEFEIVLDVKKGGLSDPRLILLGCQKTAYV